MTTQELHNLMVDAGIKPPEIIDPSLFSVNNEDIPNKGDQNTVSELLKELLYLLFSFWHLIKILEKKVEIIELTIKL